jgi:hypothetical protein
LLVSVRTQDIQAHVVVQATTGQFTDGRLRLVVPLEGASLLYASSGVLRLRPLLGGKGTPAMLSVVVIGTEFPHLHWLIPWLGSSSGDVPITLGRRP